MSWPNKNGGGVGIVTLPGGEFGGLKDPAGATLKIPYVIAQMGTTIGIGPSAVIGANGAMSGLFRQLGMVYSQGLYLYFPANAIGLGIPAGFYWTIMSSNQAGQIYNNTYTSGIPIPPSTPTPFSGTAGSSFSQDLTEITILTVSIPAGSIGAWGHVKTLAVYSSFSGGATKTFRQRFGSQLLLSNANSTAACTRVETNVVNSGTSFQKNAAGAAAVGPTGVSQPMTTTNVNTNIAQPMAYTGQVGSESDFLLIEYVKIEVFPT